MIRHVVLIAFRPGIRADRMRELETAFATLRQQIDEIRDFEWGLNSSAENLAAGFSHCFLVTFDDDWARDRYLAHPAHLEFRETLEPLLAKALVIDYRPRSGLA